MKHLIGILILVLASGIAHAVSNKWVDANGNVTYSDTVPPDVKTEKVRSIAGKGQAEAPATYSSKSYAERDADLKKSRQEKEQATSKKATEDALSEEKKRNCAVARENLRTLEEGTRVVTYEANGERTYLDDAAREQRVNDARKAISANCS